MRIMLHEGGRRGNTGGIDTRAGGRGMHECRVKCIYICMRAFRGT